MPLFRLMACLTAHEARLVGYMMLPGTIAITDYGWYDFLRQRRYWEEVNFWTPPLTGRFVLPSSRRFFSN